MYFQKTYKFVPFQNFVKD